MSNEYKDWMLQGGVCGDCIHNVFDGDDSVCAHNFKEHKEERCSFYDEIKGLI